MADLGDRTPNVSIQNNDQSKTVTVTTDGVFERLDVSSKNVNGSGADSVNIQDGGNSITIDATSLPLPTGASTSALQTTGNTSLSSIDGKLNSLGQKNAAGSVPVVICSDQSTLPLLQQGIVSSNNSTTSNLTSGSTFTGTSEETIKYATIDIEAKADQVLTVTVQQSNDNTNWDIEDVYTTPASIGDARSIKAVGRYCRILVTNSGSSTTTYLRLQTILRPLSNPLPRNLSDAGNLKVSIEESVESAAALNGNLFSVATTQTNANNTELAFFLFRNPSNSNKDFIINKLTLDVLTKGQNTTFRVYHTPTITLVGTSLPPQSRLLKGTPPTSSATVYVTPTIANNGTLISIFSAGKDSNSFVNEVGGGYVLGPGKDLLVTAKGDANGIQNAITWVWAEIPT